MVSDPTDEWMEKVFSCINLFVATKKGKWYVCKLGTCDVYRVSIPYLYPSTKYYFDIKTNNNDQIIDNI